jgi:hypothetical protein
VSLSLWIGPDYHLHAKAKRPKTIGWVCDVFLQQR